MVLSHNFGIELMNCSNRHIVFSGFATLYFLNPTVLIIFLHKGSYVAF